MSKESWMIFTLNRHLEKEQESQPVCGGKPLRVDSALMMQALLGDASECGDIGFINKSDNAYFFALIDVLGHGSEAHKVALQAVNYLENNFFNDLSSVLSGLHENLRGTRGAVVALCHLDIESGRLRYTGIGNITMRILGTRTMRFVLRDGVVGYGTISPKVQEINLLPNDVLLMHSDGIKEHFDLFEFQKMLNETAQEMAKGIMSRFGLRNDDSSCIVLKYLK